jgi:hypothetical protein
MGRKKKKQSKPWCWYPLISKKKAKNFKNVILISREQQRFIPSVPLLRILTES